MAEPALALAIQSIAIASNLYNLLSLYVKQARRSRSYERRLEEAQQHIHQIRDRLSWVVKQEIDVVEFRPQLEKLNKVLFQFRADLANANTGEDFDNAIEQLKQQVEVIEGLIERSLSPNLSIPRDDKLDEDPHPTSDHDSVTERAAPQIPKLIITDSLFEELRENRPSLVRVYSPGRVSVRADIIFVHGPSDDAKDTWSGRALEGDQDSFFWPRDLLAQDMADCAIWVYSFDANVTKVMTPDRPLIHVLDHYANELIYRIQDNRQLETRKSTRHIIWVAHSLGGLIVKNALTSSGKIASQARLAPRTKCVLFLGTPHSGSSLPARVSRLTDIIFSHGSTNKTLLDNHWWASQLHENSSIVVVASRFTALMDMQNLRVVSFFETDAVLTENGPRLMVEPFCRISHPNEDVESLEGNHHTMCKFDYEKERGYQRILGYLKKFREDSDTEPHTPVGLEQTKTRTYGKTTLTDSEFTDVGTISRRLRMRIDLPSTRWTSEKTDISSNGNWFTEESTFRTWWDSAQNLSEPIDPLLIIGPVGTGKTMIVESIIQELQMRSMKAKTLPETCQLQLFFKSNQTPQQSAVMILVGFIAQLLDQNRLLARHLSRQAEEMGEQSNDKLSRALLKGTLRRMLEDVCWRRVYVVVDGLDECAPPHVESSCDLLSWMTSFRKVRMIPTNSDEMITQAPGEGLGSHTQGYNLFSDLMQALSEKGFSIKPRLINRFSAWKTAMKLQINNTLALGTAEKTSTKQWTLVQREFRLRIQKALFDMVDLPSSPISFSLAKVILKYLRSGAMPDIETVGPLAADIRIEELLSNLANVYTVLLELVRKQEKSAVNAICILACGLEPLRTIDIVALTHFMWSSEMLDFKMITQYAGELKAKLCSPRLQPLVTIEAHGLHSLHNLVRKALLAENPAGRNKQHNLVQKEILAQMSDSDDENQIQDPVLQSNGDTMQHIVSSYLARACLRMLIAIESSKKTFSPPAKSRLSFPGEAYARKNWTAHLRGAGKLAVDLNKLVRQFLRASSSSQDVELTKTPSNPDVGALKVLAHENLFENLGAVFEDTGPLDSSGIIELDAFLSDTRSLPGPETLMVIEKNLALQPSQWSLYTRWQRRRLMRKLRLVMSVRRGRSTEFELLLSQFWPSRDEISYLAKVIIEEQNAEALNIILRDYSHRLGQQSADSLLTLAVQFQRTQLVKPMLKYPKLFDFQKGLVTAVETGNGEVCEILLEYRADVNAVNASGTTALHLAAASGLQDIVNCFVRWNASVNVTDRKGRTALHLAAEYGHTSVAETLLANSCSLTARDTKGRTALFIACACGQMDIARNLWRSGASLNDTDMKGRALLHAAARKGQKEIVKMLLGAGVGCSTLDRFEVSPLQEAAECGWVSIAELLLDAGADIMHRSATNATALHFACTAEHAPETMIDFLLAKGSDKTASDLLGRTPILLAGHFSTVRVLARFLRDDPSLKDHKDSQGHGLMDYVMFPVHLSADEERTLSANSKSEHIARRMANQREKQQLLGYDGDISSTQPDWAIYELRDLRGIQRLRSRTAEPLS